MVDNSSKPEQPRVEPEIIPPERGGRRPGWDRPTRRSPGSGWPGGTQRIYVTRLGPVGVGIMMLVFAVLLAVLLLTVLGAVLIWLPLVVLAAVAAAVYRIWRSL